MQKEPARQDGAVQADCEQGYPLRSVYFYLTEGCNLRCRHCWVEPKFQGAIGGSPALDVGLFRSVIFQAKPLGLADIKLTGGEPFLHPRIGEIIDIVREENVALSVETNGVLCTADLARRVASCGRVFVSVSLDGVDASTHEWVRGVEGSFDGALQGIRNLVDAGIRPQIIMSIMRRNREQMEALVRMAESIGASSVKFNIVQPTARGEKMREAGETLTIEELVELGAWVENSLQKKVRIPLLFNHPVAFRPMGKMYGGDWSCGLCAILNILGILSDGSCALCGIGTTVPELVFGHAATDVLSDIWRNAPALKELRDGLPRRLEGVCGACIMRDVCLGCCIAQNYYMDKHLWAGFWYCEEARAKGLFPESRIKPGLQRRAGEIAESRPAARTVLR